jgi:hypothetical protein
MTNQKIKNHLARDKEEGTFRKRHMTMLCCFTWEVNNMNNNLLALKCIILK